MGSLLHLLIIETKTVASKRRITTHALAAILWWSEGQSLESMLADALRYGKVPLEHIEQNFDESGLTPGARKQWMRLARQLRA
jgi:hypothetical protein